MKDYYEILGVSRDAAQDEIKKAFRRLARETHPDANPGDPDAEARFRDVAEAYEVLSDPQRRAAYDRGGEFAPGDLFSSFAGLDDLLQQFFGGGFAPFGGRPSRGGQRGPDLGVAVDISLAEAGFGTTQEIAYQAPTTCSRCGGSRSEPPHQPVPCLVCAGTGQVQTRRDTFLGSIMTVGECSECAGRGQKVEHPCTECRGRGRVDAEHKITVEIPAGVDQGSRLRLAGRGGAGEVRAPHGDLYVEVRIRPDDRFDRLGDDLRHVVRVGVAEAALGKVTTVPLLDGGEKELEIPAGTQPGAVFRIPREGMGRLRRRGRGDLLVAIDVVVPQELSTAQEEALRVFAAATGEQPAEPKKRRRRAR